MNLEITFRHMDHTESIDEKIRDKVNKFSQKHLNSNSKVHWTCVVEHNSHISSVNVTDNGNQFHVKAESENMYKTIDQVIEKLEAQIVHHRH